MLFIDAREGLSGDTLLAAMIGMLDSGGRAAFERRIAAAAEAHGIGFRLSKIEEAPEEGFGISYRRNMTPADRERSYEQSFSLLADFEDRMGSLAPPVAKTILQTIFGAEAEAHGLPATDVHLHEIGRPEAILNMAAIGLVSAELAKLAGGPVLCSTITTGKGIVVVSHGAVRIPAPVSEILLRGMKHVPGDSPGERATPTGIAAAKCIAEGQSDDFPAGALRTSTGFGAKRFAGRLGRTRLLLS